jgi:hypothetical protein
VQRWLGVHGFDRHPVGVDLTDHGLLAHEGLRAERRALEQLACEQRRAARDGSEVFGHGSEDGGVARPPADDDVGAGLQRGDDGLDPHDGHRSVGALDRRRIGIRTTPEPLDRHGPRRGSPRGRPGSTSLRMAASREGGEVVVGGELTHHANEVVDPAVGPGVRGRTDHQRDAELAGTEQAELEVAALPLLGAVRVIRPEGVGPDVRRARVRHDRVGGAARDPERKLPGSRSG